MISIDPGSAVVVESTYNKYAPFGSYTVQDPASTPTITVYDNKGTAMLTDQAMSKNATGQYYYIVQTLTTWKKGVYKVLINASDAPNADVKIDKRSFKIE